MDETIEMVERVAQAIAGPSEPLQDHHRKLARAAIKAMRVPTAAMIGDAGALVLNHYVGADPADSFHGTADWAKEVWVSMVNAALLP